MNYPGYPQTPPAAPREKAVTIANRNFIKSPPILIAIICYTIYAGITTINVLPSLEYLPYLFEIIDISFFLFLATFSAYILFIVPIIITIGLWTMYTSGGTNGAGTVRGGISLYVTLVITMLISLLLYLFVQLENMEYLDEFIEALFDELALPFAYLIFGLVAISSLSGFASCVEYTSIYHRPNTEGATKAGVLILIFCGLTFLAVMEIADKLGGVETLGLSLSDDNESQAAAICRLASLVLFGISALNYTRTLEQAETTNTYNPPYQANPYGQPYQPPYTPPQQPVQQAPQQPAPTAPQETAETITCSNCGTQNTAPAVFCKICGKKLGE